MMTGSVNGDLEPLLRLTLRGDSGQTCDVEALIDTGFNGFLTLPPALISMLGLPWLCRQQGQLADGSFHLFDVHVARLEWQGQPRSVEVEVADAQPLLGMALLQGLELRVLVVPGGLVAIDSP